MQATASSSMAPVGSQSHDQYFEMDNMYNMSWSTFGAIGDWASAEAF